MPATAPFTVRPAEAQELPALAEIYRAAWMHAFSRHLAPEQRACVTLGDFEERWQAFLRDTHVHSFACAQDGEPAGFVTCGVHPDRPAEIISMMVSPGLIRRGIGSRLMERALRHCAGHHRSQVVLWVVRENANARRFYERFGFAATGEQRFIWRYGARLCQLQYGKTLDPDALPSC